MTTNTKVAIGATLAGIFLCWMVWAQFMASTAIREFHHLVAESKQEVVDLRQLASVEWDEAALLFEGKNICDLGIKGYDVGGKHCRTITNERELILLLLKENSLVREIPVNRRMIDLVKSNLPTRFSKEQAVLRFVTKGDFPTVELVTTP